MASFKILAAFLAICVAQSAVSGRYVYPSQNFQDEAMRTVFGLFGSNQNFQNEATEMVFGLFGLRACAEHVPAARALLEDAKGMHEEYKRINEMEKELRAKCVELADKTEQEKCLEKVDTRVKLEKLNLLDLFHEFLPKLIDIAKKFSTCLFQV